MVTHNRNLSDMFHIKNCLKHGDALSPLLFIFALEYAIKRVQIKKDGVKVNGTYHEFWFMLMMLRCWAESYRL